MLSFSLAELMVVLTISAIMLDTKDWLKIIRYLRQAYKAMLAAQKTFLVTIKEVSDELEEMEQDNIKYIRGDDGKMHKSYQDETNTY